MWVLSGRIVLQMQAADMSFIHWVAGSVFSLFSDILLAVGVVMVGVVGVVYKGASK